MSVGDQMYDGMPIDEPEETTPASLRVRAYILRYQPTPDEESAKSLDAHADAWEADRRRLEALDMGRKLVARASDALAGELSDSDVAELQLDIDLWLEPAALAGEPAGDA